MALATLPPASNSTAAFGMQRSSPNSLVECNVHKYGTLRALSCGNALAKIPSNIKPQVFAKRPERGGETALPIRYLSGTFYYLTYISKYSNFGPILIIFGETDWLIISTDDGDCAIDLILDPDIPDARGDVQNGVGIYRAADEVIRSCVAQNSMGGQMKKFCAYCPP